MKFKINLLSKACVILFVMVLGVQNLIAQAQTITLPSGPKTVEAALDAVEKQTSMTIAYNEAAIDVKRTFNENVTGRSLAEAMAVILRGTGATYTIQGERIIIVAAQAQTPSGQTGRSIAGTVADVNGTPISGATVVVLGTSRGTITDAEGNYSLTGVSGNSELSFSFYGYTTQTVTVGNQSSISVTLVEDLLKLEEVIVVGYGTARKSDITGSVVRADLTALQESPSTNIMNALQGLVPGLNVGVATSAGSDPSFSIRGRTSISGTTTPLIVLDGIIYRGNMSDINVNDVASIDVLKDASATAIYGSQASNGVLLITTKTGTENTKPVISYSGYVSYQQASNNDLRPLNREGFLQKIADRFLSESRTGDDMLQMNPNWDPSRYMADANSLAGYNNGTDTDWWDMLTNDTPYIQSHDVSIRGKSELSSYFFSMGYLDQKNLIINDKFKRYNVRINLEMKVTDWMKIGTHSMFSAGNTSGTTPTMGNVMETPPLATAYDEGGELIRYPYKTYVNPLLQIQDQDTYKRNNLNANFYADINIPWIKGLSYRINFSQYLNSTKDYNYSETASNFQGGGYKTNASENGWTVDNILSYKNRFGKHDVDATLVYGAEKREQEQTTATAYIFTNGSLGYNYLNAGQADQQSVKSSAWQESSLYSMGRVRYTYDDKYTFTGTIRRDGFSGFGKNNKFGIFPSAAVAWRISEENFMKGTEWLDNLKLRLSYGKNGNRTISRYQTLATIGSNNGYVFGDGGSAELRQWISALANSGLKWETTNTFNIGVDFSVLNSRLFGNVEYYISNTNNLLYNINIPQIAGLSTIASNIGKLGNKGVELSLTGIPVKTKDFSWTVTFNYSRNRNKIKSILGIDANGDGKEDDLVSSKIFIGEPYGVAYDYNITGMWQLADYHAGIIPAGFTYGTYKIEDVDDDGKYTAANDRKILGYTDPSYRFSVQNAFRYKNWEFKFFINSIQGGKKYYYGQPGSSLANPDNAYQVNSSKYDWWTPENPNARYRQLGYYTQAMGESFSPYVQRSFVRLQDVTLSYAVPQSFLKKLNIARLSIYVTGKNLLTFTGWDGWDPEGIDSNGNPYGLSVGGTPLMKSYTFGLNFDL